MSQGDIILTEAGPIVWLTVSNPAKHNAMSLAMWLRLAALLSDLPAQARCLVLRGAGSRAFMSGADISEFGERRRSPDDVLAYDRAADTAMDLLEHCSIPTVAMIAGYCFGGGVATALSCDVRLAADDAVFAIPAARLGLGYSWQCVKRLVDTVGGPVATDVLISGRRMGADEALRTGLASALHPATGLEAATLDYAQAVSSNAPLTIRAARRTIRELRRVDRAPDLALCKRLITECFASSDYAEGMAAFMARRDPVFNGN